MLGIRSLLQLYVVRLYDNKMTYLLINLTARDEYNLYLPSQVRPNVRRIVQQMIDMSGTDVLEY